VDRRGAGHERRLSLDGARPGGRGAASRGSCRPRVARTERRRGHGLGQTICRRANALDLDLGAAPPSAARSRPPRNRRAHRSGDDRLALAETDAFGGAARVFDRTLTDGSPSAATAGRPRAHPSPRLGQKRPRDTSAAQRTAPCRGASASSARRRGALDREDARGSAGLRRRARASARRQRVRRDRWRRARGAPRQESAPRGLRGGRRVERRSDRGGLRRSRFRRAQAKRSRLRERSRR
jgi:hypothetical protein